MRFDPFFHLVAVLCSAGATLSACSSSSSGPAATGPDSGAAESDTGVLDSGSPVGQDAGDGASSAGGSFNYSGVVSATDPESGDCYASALQPVADSGFGSGSEFVIACVSSANPDVNLHVVIGLTAAFPPPGGTYSLSDTTPGTNGFYLELPDGGLLSNASEDAGMPDDSLSLVITSTDAGIGGGEPNILYHGTFTAKFDTNAGGIESMNATF